MVVIMKREFTPEQLEAAVHTMEEGGVKVMVSKGAETTILGAEGNAEHIDQEKLSLLPGVERVMRVTEPYNAFLLAAITESLACTNLIVGDRKSVV